MAGFTRVLPAPGQTGVPRTALVSFTVLDDAYGVQINTLTASVGGNQAIQGGSFVNGFSGQIITGSSSYVVAIHPRAPGFLPSALQIDVSLQVLDAYGSADGYSWSFFTVGYLPPGAPAPTPPGGPVPPSPPSRACLTGRPFFVGNNSGIQAALDGGIGTSVDLQWNMASPDDENNSVVYNIYLSTSRLEVFENPPRFMVTDLSATVGGLPPGDTHFFGVRASEFDPLVSTLAGLRQAGQNMFFYPSTSLVSAIGDGYTMLPAASVDGFPQRGIILIADELIKYNSLQQVPPAFITDGYGRGYESTLAEAQASGETITLYRGHEDSNTVIENSALRAQATPSFYKPNFALTYVLGDGYGSDGYRDGYDGYDAYGVDGYFFHRQVSRDDITSPNDGADASGEFERFDYCGSYRRLPPSAFWKGQCLGSYFGGIQYRNGEFVRETDVRTHMLQREELLLETSGEPFVLLRRKWTGIRCTCHMLRREHADKRCPVCFAPGSLVRTEQGLMPIEEVKVGDRVLSSDGRYHRVLRVFENEYDGNMCSLRTSVSADPLLVTPEHPFLTLQNKHNIARACGPKCDRFIVSGDGVPSGPRPRMLPSRRWWARATTPAGLRISLGTFETQEKACEEIDRFLQRNFSRQHWLSWQGADKISIGDWLVSKWNQKVIDVETISIPSKYVSPLRNGSHIFHVNEDFLWVVGMYLAEGSAGKRQINFSLHRNEVQFQNRLVRFFADHGYNSRIRKTSDNGIDVEVYGSQLSEWLPTWLGKRCFQKRIPNELICLPADKLWALVKGIHDGDGTKGLNEIGQTSKVLALQLAEILHRLGKQPLIRRQRSNVPAPSGRARKMCYVVSWENDGARHKNRKGRWVFENEILARVTSAESTRYTGKVYNLEVEGDHTYVVEGLVVHNCFGTGFQNGYEQFINSRRPDGRILVRVNPAQDDLKIEDKGGLTPEYIPGAWTIAFPGIKDRDVLVRFNENNTEEFRYQILNVERVRAFFGQAGAQKFSMQRFHRTDIIYQFPAQRDLSPYPATAVTGSNSAPGIPEHSHVIQVPNGIAIANLNGVTAVSEKHSHVIRNGVVCPALGHTHTLTL